LHIERVKVTESLKNFTPKVKGFSRSHFDKFSHAFKLKVFRKGDVIQKKGTFINSIFLVRKGECEKIIFENPLKDAFGEPLFGKIGNLNYFSETFAKYRISKHGVGDWINYEYIFMAHDDHRCPYNIVVTEEFSEILEINRKDFNRLIPPFVKEAFGVYAKSIVQNLPGRLGQIENTSKGVMEMNLSYDYREMLGENKKLGALSKNLAKKEFVGYLADPEASGFRKYLIDMRKRVNSTIEGKKSRDRENFTLEGDYDLLDTACDENFMFKSIRANGSERTVGASPQKTGLRLTAHDFL
jgi:CRP-like cAMP-binding protein